MKTEQLRATASGLHIEGYPDAVRAIRLDGPRARQLAHFGLHKSDLEFARDCLDAINETQSQVVRWALWRSAIVYFTKCFQAGKSAGVRSTGLAEKIIYKGDPEGRDLFRIFDHLRNKHIAHDENSYSQSIPCAAINGGGKSYKVERILTLCATGDTLDQPNYANLRLLITKALDWVTTKYDALCVDLTAELERAPLDALLAREQVKLAAPKLEEVGKRRKGF
jgi:hypothetical protein